ncbi:asparagine synthetase B family protein [Photobacterium kishitanii]|uniref:asparagine synthetase B family protein n=1 Tax=Photobacterium kishitanii TaxID=318456 RepID=UPI00071AED3B|nr:asparagine synthase-related protein [Photobacterium kishitanii]
MCGFFITNDPMINQTHLATIEKTLRFRGPDCSSGLIENNEWKAYHSRLAIIDINSGENQPVINNNGMLVFNGEILNYKDLGFKYFNKEYKSDTLLLSDLLLNEKLDLNELDGFFSFVYIKNGQLVRAVRDKFGVKPLFYYENNGYVSFCSEPITLKELYSLNKNPIAIEEYLTTRSPIFSGSYFDGVKVVEPGHCFVGGLYFDCSDYLNGSYKDISINDIEKALLDGIKTRKVSDAPVGLLLSRGIDSNLLKEMGGFERYYSIGFKGDADIEYLKAENIPNLTLIECEPSDYLSDFNYLLELRGEPMSVPNEVLLYRISKYAAVDGVKVLLSGEGADEFFAGYDRVFKWAAETKEFDLDTFLELYCYLKPQKDSLVYNKFKSLFESKIFINTFEKVRWFFIRYHMPILFRRLDFSLMAAGVEGREPIANMHLFLLAVQMSPESLMGDILGKIPLRNVISKYKGDNFAFEKKVGFPVDLTAIFENKKQLTSYELWFEENLKVLK